MTASWRELSCRKWYSISTYLSYFRFKCHFRVFWDQRLSISGVAAMQWTLHVVLMCGLISEQMNVCMIIGVISPECECDYGMFKVGYFFKTPVSIYLRFVPWTFKMIFTKTLIAWSAIQDQMDPNVPRTVMARRVKSLPNPASPT